MLSSKNRPIPSRKTTHLINAYWLALRPHQWTKNLIVFAAPLFAFDITLGAFLSCLMAFGLFCATSSSFYLLNDIFDVQADRQHPVKCKRPIAAGLIPIPIAFSMALVLLVGAIAIAWCFSKWLGLILICYALLQVAYNLRLKQMVFLDVMAIAAGFVLRAGAGAVATGIVLSSWFLLCTAMLALFLGIEKRKAELRLAEVKGKTTRTVLKHYSLSLLSRMEYTVTTGTILTYSLWSSGPQVQGASTPWMMLTIPFVLYGVFRYQLLSDPGVITIDVTSEHTMKTERPDEILLKDVPVLMTVIGWVLAVFVILLLKRQGVI
jgi:4-hydroxybenzoate polyprenyltransferase